MVPSIARTAGWMVFGLRNTESIMSTDHPGCIDRSPFIAAGSTVRHGNHNYTEVVCINAERDFPEPSK